MPPAGASLQQAGASPAVVLFVHRACAVGVDFHSSACNHLAIELAASRIRAFSPAEMLGKQGRPVLKPGDTLGLELLTRPGQQPSTQPSRHASTQRTIAWSWQQLRHELQLLAAAMAVFPGGCDARMLTDVQGGPDVAAGLEQLHAHSLVHAQRVDAAFGVVQGGDTPRFQLYQPIREFAASRFDAAHGLE